MGKDARRRKAQRKLTLLMFAEKPNLVLMSCPIGEGASPDAFRIVTPASEGS
jgi:hypothetical protein